MNFGLIPPDSSLQAFEYCVVAHNVQTIVSLRTADTRVFEVVVPLLAAGCSLDAGEQRTVRFAPVDDARNSVNTVFPPLTVRLSPIIVSPCGFVHISSTPSPAQHPERKESLARGGV
jgi:hypothetical protein